MSTSTADRFEWVVLAVVVTAAAATVPNRAAVCFDQLASPTVREWAFSHVGWNDLNALLLLAFATALVLPRPIRGGLAVPDLSGWRKWRVAVVYAGCVGLTLAFNRRLDMPQLRGTDRGYWMWLIGPPAEDLVFAGFLLGKFRPLWPGPVARRVPVDRAVVVSAVFFSLWHAQNFQAMSSAFVCQQMLYTFAAGVVLGLTRQWTGSILFVTVTHMSANWLAWHDVGL